MSRAPRSLLRMRSTPRPRSTRSASTCFARLGRTQDQLFISDVIHQANIDVDEKGTTASAASAVMIAGLAAPAPPVTLRVDRPFLFALRDIPTGAIVFLGRVTDPSAKG